MASRPEQDSFGVGYWESWYKLWLDVWGSIMDASMRDAMRIARRNARIYGLSVDPHPPVMRSEIDVSGLINKDMKK